MTISFDFSISLPSSLATTPTPTSAQVAGANALRDKKLGEITNDLVLDDTGDLVYLSGVESIASDLKSRWLTVKGEWYLNVNLGVDYYGLVFVKAPDLGAIEAEFRREALATPGVSAIALQLQQTGRALAVAAQVTTDTGLIFGVGLNVQLAAQQGV